MPTRSSHRPVEVEIDPFSAEFLADPHPYHTSLREAGAVVRLAPYGIWAAARYREVAAALQDWQTFCSGRGVGLSDFAKERPWRPPSIILEADPPLHTRTRTVLTKVLSRPALQGLKQRMDDEAATLMEEVLAAPRIDAVARIAQSFPLRVFPDAVGLIREGRENLLPYGDMAFNAFGPRNQLFERSMTRAEEVSGWILAQCRRSALAPEGLGAKIYEQADAGLISEEEAGMLVRSLLTAGLDTTIQGIAHALLAFAQHPQEWALLQQRPELVKGAFEEAIRFGSPVQTFFRTVTRDVELGGQMLAAGDKVLLFLAAANRDPRRWVEPDRFSVTRESAGHVGFGLGIHQCVGQMVARLEAEAVLSAMLKRIDALELEGLPEYHPNNTLRTLKRLPLKLRSKHKAHAPRRTGQSLQLLVASRRVETQNILSFELVDPHGGRLPSFAAGAHLDVKLPPDITRQFSLCGDPADRYRYRIAVMREPNSRGGSQAMHELVQEGHLLQVSEPKNHFPLAMDATRVVLLAAGVGITPMLSMAYELHRRSVDFELHYCTKSAEHAAFRELLERCDFAHRVAMHYSRGERAGRLDPASILPAPLPDTHLYVCGPQSFIDQALTTARARGWSAPQLHFERFTAKVTHLAADSAFEVILARSGRAFQVSKHLTIATVLTRSGVSIPLSCEQGVCGTCLTRVLEGTPDHRDCYLTPDERARNDQMALCCSRSTTPRLVLDL